MRLRAKTRLGGGVGMLGVWRIGKESLGGFEDDKLGGYEKEIARTCVFK